MGRGNPSSGTAPFTVLTLALVSASGLIFEITLTRIFSLYFQYHFAFLAVSVAVFSLSLGAWPMTIDRDDNSVVPIVGPGDVPNIAIALLRIHHLIGSAQYLEAAARAFRCSLSIQVMPGSSQPYADDPNVQWGFWSWDP